VPLGALALVVALLAAPFTAQALQAGKVPRIGLIGNTTPVHDLTDPERRGPVLRAFVQRLRELGWVEGQSIAFEWRSAEGRAERLPGIMSELVRLKVDAIVTGDTRMAQIAKRMTSTIPIVMGATDEPVEAGLVTSLSRPGGNLTGFSLVVGPQVAGKHLQLLKELAPGISRVAVISESALTPSSLAWRRETDASAQKLGLIPLWITVDRQEQLAEVLPAISGGRADALVAQGTTTNFSYRHRLIALATDARLPALYGHPEMARAGGLMAYGADVVDNFRRAAEYVDRILRGAQPGGLPIQQPVKFLLVLNLRQQRSSALRPHSRCSCRRTRSSSECIRESERFGTCGSGRLCMTPSRRSGRPRSCGSRWTAESSRCRSPRPILTTSIRACCTGISTSGRRA
jgi:putative ABC transport system substrate-binding protein